MLARLSVFAVGLGEWFFRFKEVKKTYLYLSNLLLLVAYLLFIQFIYFMVNGIIIH